MKQHEDATVSIGYSTVVYIILSIAVQYFTVTVRESTATTAEKVFSRVSHMILPLTGVIQVVQQKMDFQPHAVAGWIRMSSSCIP